MDCSNFTTKKNILKQSALKFNLPRLYPSLYSQVVKSQIELVMVINYFPSETKTWASCKSLYLWIMKIT